MLASNVCHSITARAMRSVGASCQVSMISMYDVTRIMSAEIACLTAHFVDASGLARDVVHSRRQAGRDNFKINNRIFGNLEGVNSL